MNYHHCHHQWWWQCWRTIGVGEQLLWGKVLHEGGGWQLDPDKPEGRGQNTVLHFWLKIYRYNLSNYTHCIHNTVWKVFSWVAESGCSEWILWLENSGKIMLKTFWKVSTWHCQDKLQCSSSRGRRRSSSRGRRRSIYKHRCWKATSAFIQQGTLLYPRETWFWVHSPNICIVSNWWGDAWWYWSPNKQVV